MSHDVLDRLPASERDRLLAKGVVRDVPRGELLQLAGSPAERVHLVHRGVVTLAVRDAEGEETILALAGPGSFVGEQAAIDGCPQPFDAIAATPATVTGFDAATFVEAVFSSPSACRALATRLTARTRELVDAALERATGEVDARLAGRLLELARLLGRESSGAIELDLPLPQRDLGKLAGMCRESTCKTMRRMKRHGIVDYQGRRLRILRPDTLELLRCGQRLR